jgi:hypothetical protein
MGDMGALSVITGQAKVSQKLDIAAMKLAMKDQSQQGDALTNMIDDTKDIQRAAQPHLGANIDIVA